MTPIDWIPLILSGVAVVGWIVINCKLQHDCMKLDPVYGFLAWVAAVLLGFVVGWRLVMGDYTL